MAMAGDTSPGQCPPGLDLPCIWIHAADVCCCVCQLCCCKKQHCRCQQAAARLQPHAAAAATAALLEMPCPRPCAAGHRLLAIRGETCCDLLLQCGYKGSSKIKVSLAILQEGAASFGLVRTSGGIGSGCRQVRPTRILMHHIRHATGSTSRLVAGSTWEREGPAGRASSRPPLGG